MKKQNKDIKISFIGENSHDVTGSMILIEYENHKILLECGLYQSSSMIKDYQINSRKFRFKPTEITEIFINHGSHIDHLGLVPALYKSGNNCKAKIIIPEKTKGIMKLLLEDSAYINKKNSELLSRQSGKEVRQIYTIDDVYKTLEYTEEYKTDIIYKIDNNLSFRLTYSGHVFGSCQLELFITNNGIKKTLLYTSDLGNISIGKKDFVQEFKPIEHADILIGESTYANKLLNVSYKTREKDYEKIKTAVYDIIDKNKGRICFPSFSFARTQEILSDLYKIFKDDKKFNIPIYLDSPLAIKITEEYLNILDKDKSEYLKEILSWENLKIISSVDDSKINVNSNEVSIIISASGMLMAGRVMNYLPKILEDENSIIISIGYSPDDSILGKIKSKKYNTIFVEGLEYKNKCNLVELKSYSSHIQHKEMLEYYSSIKGLKTTCLVHGDFENKIKFAELLEKEYEKKCQSTKIYAIDKDDVIYI